MGGCFLHTGVGWRCTIALHDGGTPPVTMHRPVSLPDTCVQKAPPYHSSPLNAEVRGCWVNEVNIDLNIVKQYPRQPTALHNHTTAYAGGGCSVWGPGMVSFASFRPIFCIIYSSFTACCEALKWTKWGQGCWVWHHSGVLRHHATPLYIIQVI